MVEPAVDTAAEAAAEGAAAAAAAAAAGTAAQGAAVAAAAAGKARDGQRMAVQRMTAQRMSVQKGLLSQTGLKGGSSWMQMGHPAEGWGDPGTREPYPWPAYNTILSRMHYCILLAMNIQTPSASSTTSLQQGCLS